MTALVELAVEDKVAIVTLSRPEVRNAINDALRAELVAVLERVAADDGRARGRPDRQGQSVLFRRRYFRHEGTIEGAGGAGGL